MQSNLNSIILEQLDIVGYVSYPNLINTCYKHVGTLYHIEPNLGKLGFVHGWYTFKAHSIDGIIQMFKGEDNNNMPLCYCMSDWPLGSQKEIYFEHVKFHEGKYNSIEELMKEEEERVKDTFSLTYKGHYSDLHVLALRHFTPSMQNFLKDFYQRISHIVPDENTSKQLAKRWREDEIPENIIKYLQSYRIEKDSGGIEKIVLEDSAYVHLFRQELSNWLQKCGYSIDELLEKGNINVTAASGTGHFVKADKINVIGVKITQMTSTSPAERLPEQWNVPPKNSNFIGRRKLLKQIEDHFSQKTALPILTACHGLGGIGKTRVALEFVWQHYKKYKGVVWFNAESRDRLQNDYISLGRELNIIRDDDNINAGESAYYVKHWLEDSSHAGWLLVYDNADNYKAIRELLPTKGGKILITSRHTADWPQEIPIDVFTIDESRDYILKVLNTQISESDLMQIKTFAETLGRLPLAIAQAAAYLKRNKMSISDYLKYYKQKKSHILNSKILPSDYHASVFITWDITMEAIRKESLLAASLLNSCAFLASDDIPNFLLEKLANTPENNPDSEIFEEALGTLDCYSMLAVNKQNHSSSIHRLVQEVIRIKWGKEKTYDLMNILNLLIDSFPYKGQTIADYDMKRQLLPHLEAFTTHLDAWQQEEYQLRKDKEKECLIRIADGYKSLGNAEKVRELLERVLAIEERHCGLDHPNVATTLTNLGNAYGKLGDTQKKRDLLERALAIEERHFGLDHPEVAITLNNLGNAYGYLGDTQKKRDLLERALAIEERHFGLEHPEVAATLANLGNAYGKLGETQKKRDLLERALAIEERHFRPDHPEVAITLTNLGNAYGKLGDTHKSRELLERALVIEERHFGLDHPEVAATLTKLGNVYEDLGDIQKSREFLERALAIKEKHYGLNHPNMAITLNNLGIAYGKLGDIQKSCEFLERALAIKERHFGLDHPEVAATLTNLGNAYGKLGDTQKSCGFLERELAIKERHLRIDHPEVAAILTNLGNVYGKLGDIQKSREFLERAFAINKDILV
jgi:tetratricopeptide (TPR) repeat protein